MYAAIDMVLDKLESQIKKNKEKIRERRRTGAKFRDKTISTAETSRVMTTSKDRLK
jgi:ribosome-associated translation inhibitor RaiA